MQMTGASIRANQGDGLVAFLLRLQERQIPDGAAANDKDDFIQPLTSKCSVPAEITPSPHPHERHHGIVAQICHFERTAFCRHTKRGLPPCIGTWPLPSLTQLESESDATPYAGITQVRFKGYSLSPIGTPVTLDPFYPRPSIKSSKFRDPADRGSGYPAPP